MVIAAFVCINRGGIGGGCGSGSGGDGDSTAGQT